jgi:aerobic carbon-monoxide dehydrogenase medium subunit
MGRVLQPFEYFEPTTIAEALKLAAAPKARLIAGGCELVLAMRRGQRQYSRLVSILGLPGISQFSAHPKKGIECGATVRIRELANHIWVGKRWAALHEAIEQLHPPHIMNMGTVVGNICCAVPYYDLPTAMYAHRASVRITNGKKVRLVPIEKFYLGAGKTDVKPGEMVSGLSLPPPAADAGSAFKKIYVARRQKDDLHKINAAAYIALDKAREKIVDATLVIGSVGPKPVRILKAEAYLKGKGIDTDVFAAAAEHAATAIKFSSRLAWTDEVKSEWVRVLARDVLQQAASRAKSRHDPAEDAQLAY